MNFRTSISGVNLFNFVQYLLVDSALVLFIFGSVVVSHDSLILGLVVGLVGSELLDLVCLFLFGFFNFAFYLVESAVDFCLFAFGLRVQIEDELE